MNVELFDNVYKVFDNLLENLNLTQKELKHRKNNFSKAYIELISNNIWQSFFSQLHEIKSIDFFTQLPGFLVVYEDSSSIPGVDIEYNKTQIEFVVASTGNENTKRKLLESGFNEYNKMIDLNPKHDQMILRFSSVLKDKSIKFLNDSNNNYVNKDQPFIIFMSLGELDQEWHHGEYCVEALKFLIGRGQLSISFNPKNLGEGVYLDYGYRPLIEKKENVNVLLNFFGDEVNSHVSAVLLSTAGLRERYNEQNVYMFANPYAVNPLDFESFPNIVVWKNFGVEYKPTRGNIILERESMKFF